MFVPIHDDNPLTRIHRPVVTWTLIAVTSALFLLSTGGGIRVLASFGIVPRELFGSAWGASFSGGLGSIAVPERMTPFTYMFLHGDIFHLIGNMAFLYVFGDNVEDALGHARFLAFYLLCGVAGGLAHAYAVPASTMPLIGASAAVAGVVVAYLMLYPRVRVWVLVMRIIPLQITALFVLGLWVATQFAMAALPYVLPGVLDHDNVSWWAHVGGIIAGILLILAMKPRRVAARG